jgi:hypothetical protein
MATVAGAQPVPPDEGPPPGERGRGGGLFISPMGEPFRGPDAMGAWFRGADRNNDGRLFPAECTADAARFFATLDTNGDGEIDPDELTRYETEVVPEVQSGIGGEDLGAGRRGGGRGGGGHGGGGGHRGGGMGGGGPDPDAAGGGQGERSGSMPARPQGAARFGLLDLPEPVIAADSDFNRGVSRAEFRDAALRRCHLLDRDNDGAVAWAELPARPGPGRRGPAKCPASSPPAAASPPAGTATTPPG